MNEINELKNQLIKLKEELEYSQSIIDDPNITGEKRTDAFNDCKYYLEEIRRIDKEIAKSEGRIDPPTGHQR